MNIIKGQDAPNKLFLTVMSILTVVDITWVIISPNVVSFICLFILIACGWLFTGLGFPASRYTNIVINYTITPIPTGLYISDNETGEELDTLTDHVSNVLYKSGKYNLMVTQDFNNYGMLMESKYKLAPKGE